MESSTRLVIYAVIFFIFFISIILLIGFTIIPFDAMSTGSYTYETTDPVKATILAIIAFTSGGLLIIILILEIIYKIKKIKSMDKE